MMMLGSASGEMLIFAELRQMAANAGLLAASTISTDDDSIGGHFVQVRCGGGLADRYCGCFAVLIWTA